MSYIGRLDLECDGLSGEFLDEDLDTVSQALMGHVYIRQLDPEGDGILGECLNEALLHPICHSPITSVSDDSISRVIVFPVSVLDEGLHAVTHPLHLYVSDDSTSLVLVMTSGECLDQG